MRVYMGWLKQTPITPDTPVRFIGRPDHVTTLSREVGGIGERTARLSLHLASPNSVCHVTFYCSRPLQIAAFLSPFHRLCASFFCIWQPVLHRCAREMSLVQFERDRAANRVHLGCDYIDTRTHIGSECNGS
jgi:hypothetical protein